MFTLIQLPNLRWIPKALSFSLSPQSPSPIQLAKDTIEEIVRNFILIRLTVLLIDSNRKRLNWHPQRIFGKLSTEVLSRCNIPYYRTPYDIRSSWSMHSQECKLKNDPIDKIHGKDSIAKYIPCGVVIASTAYAHLKSRSTQVFIALYMRSGWYRGRFI